MHKEWSCVRVKETHSCSHLRIYLESPATTCRATIVHPLSLRHLFQWILFFLKSGSHSKKAAGHSSSSLFRGLTGGKPVFPVDQTEDVRVLLTWLATEMSSLFPPLSTDVTDRGRTPCFPQRKMDGSLTLTSQIPQKTIIFPSRRQESVFFSCHRFSPQGYSDNLERGGGGGGVHSPRW